jgi:predicted DsbA family dithiol-disulfide isomerase
VNVAPGTIQVWSDLLCPFAHVAIYRLRTARTKLGLDDAVRLDHHTFALELFNGPHSRPGTDSEAVGLGQLAPEIGFRLWTQPDWTYPSTVLLAAEAVHAAKPQGLQASEDLDAALRRAFWFESRTIGHRQVILEIRMYSARRGVDVTQQDPQALGVDPRQQIVRPGQLDRSGDADPLPARAEHQRCPRGPP